MASVRAVLIDLSGVLYVDDEALPGSVEALKKLQASGLPHCFLTNTTRQTRASLQSGLRTLGFNLDIERLMTAASAARSYVEQHRLQPCLLIHPGLAPEFADLATNRPDAVVVGDAGPGFDYASMNKAFRVLMENSQAPLISMGANRYFREADGLSLDMGPFVAALEYASGRQAVVTGKPSRGFFQAALDKLGVAAADAVMIGDDLENDIGGARSAGIAGILVRTGKYRPEDEQHPEVHPDSIADDFAAAVEQLLAA